MLETIYLRHFFLSHGAGIYPVGSVLTKLYFGRREVVFIFPPAAVIRLIVTCEAQSGNLLGRRHVDDNGLCLAIGTVIAQLSAIGEVAIKEFFGLNCGVRAVAGGPSGIVGNQFRSEEHTSELQS